MHRKFILSSCLTLLALLGQGAQLEASKCLVTYPLETSSYIDPNTLENLLKDLFSSSDLSPILNEENLHYQVVAFEPPRWFEPLIVYGVLRHDQKSIHAVCSIDQGWFSSSAELLYISADDPISPLLFKDISSLSLALLPTELSEHHLIILKDTKLSNGKTQVWRYYNQHYYQDFLVILLDASDGGTDFGVVPDELLQWD